MSEVRWLYTQARLFQDYYTNVPNEALLTERYYYSQYAHYQRLTNTPAVMVKGKFYDIGTGFHSKNAQNNKKKARLE